MYVYSIQPGLSITLLCFQLIFNFPCSFLCAITMASSAVKCLILLVYNFNTCFSDLGITLQAAHAILLMFLFFAISAG